MLVAEDNPTSRMVTEALLKKLSCEVDIAVDGREALQKARSGDYDIVFMDCYMPLMDGFQATQRIRRSPGNEELPVIALTASVTEEDQIRCLGAGMNDTIGKPVRISMLAKALERWVPISGGRSRRPASTHRRNHRRRTGRHDSRADPSMPSATSCSAAISWCGWGWWCCCSVLLFW